MCFNLAAVLEATGEEEEALVAYQRAEKLGIERAAVNIRNVSVWRLFNSAMTIQIRRTDWLICWHKIGAKLLGKIRQEEEEKAKKGESESAATSSASTKVE